MDSEMKVVWSYRARITYFNVLDYLDKNWTKKEIIRFNKRTEIVINAIRKNPGIFPFSLRYTNIRKAVIDKNNSFFYQVDEGENIIYLLTFFDNRQNPENLKLDNSAR